MSRRCGSRDHCPRRAVWALWVSADHGAFVAAGLADQPLTGGADLEAGGAESAAEAAEARSALVGRRIVCTAAAALQKPPLEWGLRAGSDRRWAAAQDPHADR